jgi:hypothetical protein
MANSTQNLFEELQEISKTSPKPSPAPSKQALDNVPAAQSEQENFQILLVDYAYLFNAFLRDAYYWEGVKTGQKNFEEFIRLLEELDQMPDSTNKIYIKFRGLRSAKVPDHIDYVIEYGNLTLDLAKVISLIKRLGIRYKHLEGRLSKAFEAFSTYGLRSLVVSIPGDNDTVTENLRTSIAIFSQFNKAIENETPIVFDNDEEEQISINPICDENRQPNFNLTLVAALNGLSDVAMNEFIQKIAAVQDLSAEQGAAGDHSDIYNAIFNIGKLGQKLTRPPLEIYFNDPEAQVDGKMGPAGTTDSNSSQLGSNPGASAAGETALSAEAAASNAKNAAQPGTDREASQEATTANMNTSEQSQAPAVNPEVLKAFVTKVANNRFKGSPKDATLAVNSIYGDDYDQVDAKNLSERVKYINDLLAPLDKNPKAVKVIEGITQRLEKAVAQMPQDVLDDVIIDDGELKLWSNDEGSLNTKVNKNLLGVIETAKKRNRSNKEHPQIPDLDKEFSDEDYETLADNFNIGVEEAKEIAGLLKNCVNERGNFVRPEFEKKVSDFSQHKKTIFPIVWQFLKNFGEEKNCFSFLNALQVLVEDLQQPIDAIKILLADFCLEPKKPTFQDRMAMMLCNQYIRTYNKERHLDIEITPEEVLLVQDGVNRRVQKYARWKINGEKKAFLQKAITIREHLQESLNADQSDDLSHNIRSLLTLEREIYIFLSIAGGEIGYTLLRDALSTYGNPKSPIYQQKASHIHASALIQHLAVIIRGFGRLGKTEDIKLFEDVRTWQNEFLVTKDGSQNDEALARKIISLIDKATKDIQSRSDNTNQNELNES